MFKPGINRRGVVLFIVLATLLVVVSLSSVILSIILNNARITYHQTNRIEAYYAAMAGVNLAIEKLRDGSWTTNSYTLCSSGCSVNDGDMPYRVDIDILALGTSIDGIGRKITAKATYTYTP